MLYILVVYFLGAMALYMSFRYVLYEVWVNESAIARKGKVEKQRYVIADVVTADLALSETGETVLLDH